MTANLWILAAMASTALSAAPPVTATEAGSMKSVETLAGTDLRALYEVLCPVDVLQPPAVDITDRSTWYAPPAAALDDLFYVGQKGVSAWALKTDEGLVIFDSLFDYSVGPEIVDGLKTLGLDPATIRYVIVTHAHADHYGGARFLQDNFGARVVASRADWDGIEADTRSTDPKPRRDIVVDGSLDLRLGDATIEIVETPGHTPGSISMLFPVHDQGRHHIAALWGGTAFKARTREAYESMRSSAMLFGRLAKDRNAEVWLSNHPVFDNTFAKLAKDSADDGASAFVTGSETVQRAMAIAGQCSQIALKRDYP